ncbi:MAG: TRAP transporter fused permease subunit [Kordiimonadaceae bacterium]|nr:TRAP transporter fused permease subunit [Kordiimonadaceae bacterium]MBT6036970.1 TRAP transporter fused permease subunit [Kordiimonadaceae bacterium]MBT6328609.1 TRAP transporter fused permease subunit [Kordiimonadaceae bacterium]
MSEQAEISEKSESSGKKLFNLFIFGLPILCGICWIMGVPLQLGIAILSGNYLAFLIAFALGASFVFWPYGAKPSLFDYGLAIMAAGVWLLCAYNYQEWLLNQHDRTPFKIIMAVLAIGLLTEGVRKTTGNGMAGVIVLSLLYGVFGHNAPGIFEGAQNDYDALFTYLYIDSSAVLGFIIMVAGTLILGFLVMGQVMQASGATNFFSDVAMAAIGHRRGGPAKVSVVGSSLMGMVSGATVANIMSTGMVSIPLMKRNGFKASMAAGIEAVASNGSQLAPPVMGATAFIIAEYLELPYTTIVAAAIIPAIVYYLFLFCQIDFYARDKGLEGLKKSDLPNLANVLKAGWLFIIPLGVLVFYLFVLSYNPAKSALYASLSLLMLALLKYRKLPTWDMIYKSIVQLGKPFVMLVMICGGAGIIIGVINMSGLGFSLALALSDVGALYGLFVMLILTAIISIILGMGMPTSAVYIIVAMLLAPSIADMGVPLIAAHFFVFYFGLASFLTPPVAIASYAAASLAKADLTETSIAGLKLGLSAFIIPFYFIYNPEILLIGTWQEIAIAATMLAIAGVLLARAITFYGSDADSSNLHGTIDIVVCLLVGTATIWTPEGSLLIYAVMAFGFSMIIFGNRFLRSK